jgi:hypothetical protein
MASLPIFLIDLQVSIFLPNAVKASVYYQLMKDIGISLKKKNPSRKNRRRKPAAFFYASPRRNGALCLDIMTAY